MIKGLEELDRQALIKLIGRAVREAPEDHLFVVQLAYSNSKNINRLQEPCTGTSSLETVLLCLAASSGRCDVIRFLLSKGAPLEAEAVLARDDKWPGCCRNALHHSISRKQEDAVRVILEYGADVNSEPSFYHLTPLQRAIGCPGITRLLVENEADINLGKELSPLQLAAQDGSNEEIELLLSHGADIEDPKMDGILRMEDTPLMAACQVRNFTGARKLLELGADVNAQFPESAEIFGGVTPLYLAVTGSGMCARRSTTRETVEVLLEYGANINKTYEVKPDWGDNMAEYTVKKLQVSTSTKSILSIAINVGNPSVVALLLDKGAQWEDTDPFRSTPLQAWIVSRPDSWWKNKSLSMLKVLLGHGSDPNEVLHGTGNTPLIEACSGRPLSSRRSIIKELVQCGADLDKLNYEKNNAKTAMHEHNDLNEMWPIFRDFAQYSTGNAQERFLKLVALRKKDVKEDVSPISPTLSEEQISDGSAPSAPGSCGDSASENE